MDKGEHSETIQNLLDDLEKSIETGGETSWHDRWDRLTVDEREELARMVVNAPRSGPQEGPQTAAYISPANVVGYGGAAGGGKSALIALLAIHEHTRSVVFRADGKQLTGLIDDTVNFLGTSVGLNRQASVFRFPHPDHMMEWGGIGGPGDEKRWQGRAHDFLAFDEATEIPEAKINYLSTWCRSAKPNQRTRIVFTFNPPDHAEGRWVIDYFRPWLDVRVAPELRAQPGEVRWFYRDHNGDQHEVADGSPIEINLGGKPRYIKPQSRTFIPALIQDNAYLRGGNYESHLASLTEPLRSQMLLGDFTAGIQDSEFQVIPTGWVELAQERWNANGCRHPMNAMGVDVARGGRDFTVLARRHGWWWDELLRKKGADTPNGPSVASFAMEFARDNCLICIDSIGVGASPFDFLERTYAYTKAVVSSRAQNLRRIERNTDFNNLRSMLWWQLRKVLDPANGLNPALPRDDKLRAELISPTFRRVGGKIAIEPKLDTKKRLGYSPDDADAVIYSMADLEMDGTPHVERIRPNLAPVYPPENLYTQATREEILQQRKNAFREGRGLGHGISINDNADWMSQ